MTLASGRLHRAVVEQQDATPNSVCELAAAPTRGRREDLEGVPGEEHEATPSSKCELGADRTRRPSTGSDTWTSAPPPMLLRLTTILWIATLACSSHAADTSDRVHISTDQPAVQPGRHTWTHPGRSSSAQHGVSSSAQPAQTKPTSTTQALKTKVFRNSHGARQQQGKETSATPKLERGLISSEPTPELSLDTPHTDTSIPELQQSFELKEEDLSGADGATQQQGMASSTAPSLVRSLLSSDPIPQPSTAPGLGTGLKSSDGTPEPSPGTPQSNTSSPVYTENSVFDENGLSEEELHYPKTSKYSILAKLRENMDNGQTSNEIKEYRVGILGGSRFQWQCNTSVEPKMETEDNLAPWSIRGGKVALLYVFTKVTNNIRRHVLRSVYNQYPEFDVTYAVGHPTEAENPDGLVTARVCEEQHTEGDMPLVSFSDTMNDGKMPYTHTNGDMTLVSFSESMNDGKMSYTVKQLATYHTNGDMTLVIFSESMNDGKMPNTHTNGDMTLVSFSESMNDGKMPYTHTNGDMTLVSFSESMNDGKMYYTVKQLATYLRLIYTNRKRWYRFIIKVDDDTYVHMPHLSHWMKSTRSRAITLGHFTMFGPRLQHYYYGSFNGFSIELFLDVASKIEERYMGGHFEDWLLGAWMRMYGPTDMPITDVHFEPAHMLHIDYLEHNVTNMAKEVKARANTLVFFHTKELEDLLYLREVLMKEVDSNRIKSRRMLTRKSRARDGSDYQVAIAA
eukprot:gene11994-15088_t